MVNIMKFIREKKQAIKEYSKKRNFEKQRDLELEEIKLEKEAEYHSKLLERQKRIEKSKAIIKKSRENTFVGKIAKNIGRNVLEAQKSMKKRKKKKEYDPFESSKNNPWHM